jgi:glutathione-regulated potassium-efflux system ancillary protein KefC
MNHEILFEAFIFLIASCIVVPLIKRFKLSAIIGYLLAGILIGPMCLKLVSDSEGVMHLAEFGIIMMLFVIGLELEPATLWRLRKSIVGIGGLQVVLTTAVFTAIGIALKLNWQVSLAIAMALSLSSTALVLNLLQEKNLLNSKIGETSFAVLLFQDIAVIPILILMPFLAQGGLPNIAPAKTLISDLSAFSQAGVIAAVILAVVLVGQYLSRYFFHAVAKSNLRELFTALSLALIIGITLLTQQIGVSPALGAFIAGVVLANSEYRKNIETDIRPFKGLLLGLFFISVGMKMDFSLLASKPSAILAVVFGLMLIKTLIMWALGRIFKLSNCDSIGYAMTLCQGGEFAFVLFQFSGNLSLLDDTQIKFLTMVVALSIAFTPFVISVFNKIMAMRCVKSEAVNEEKFDKIDQQHPIILAGFGRFGQVVGRFLMSQGFQITVLEKDPDQIELLRKFGFKAYFGDATHLDFLRTAHAERATALIIAIDDLESILAIAENAKKEFPSLAIFARAHNRQHAYDLHKIGVTSFKREMFDSSLAFGIEIATWLGKDDAEMKLKAEKFKIHDEETLKESFQFFEDEPALINFAKTRRDELEKILKSDNAPS